MQNYESTSTWVSNLPFEDGPNCVLITQGCNVSSFIKITSVVLEEANVFIHVYMYYVITIFHYNKILTLHLNKFESNFPKDKFSRNWPSNHCDKKVFNVLFPWCSYCLSLETKHGPLNKIEFHLPKKAEIGTQVKKKVLYYCLCIFRI